MLRGLRRMSSKVVLRSRSLHGRCGHWDGRCIVTDRTQCLRVMSVMRDAYPRRLHVSYLAWPTHREHASFLRHGGRSSGLARVLIAAVGRRVARRYFPSVYAVVYVCPFGMRRVSKRATYIV
jgi:hypothetical protein